MCCIDMHNRILWFKRCSPGEYQSGITIFIHILRSLSWTHPRVRLESMRNSLSCIVSGTQFYSFYLCFAGLMLPLVGSLTSTFAFTLQANCTGVHLQAEKLSFLKSSRGAGCRIWQKRRCLVTFSMTARGVACLKTSAHPSIPTLESIFI